MSRVPTSSLALVGLLGLFAGCSSPSANGVIVDAMTGGPVAEARVVASAVGQTSLTCMNFETTTDAQGAFEFASLCDAEYKLKLDDETLWLAEVDSIPAGGAENLEVKVWRAPASSGYYRLSGGEIENIRVAGEVMKEKIKGTEELAHYPANIPNTVPVIGPDDHLVIVGQGTIEQTRIDPLVPSGPRVFGDAEVEVKMDAWSYLGITFTDDTTFVRSTAQVDDSKAFTKEKGDRIVRFIPGSAIPAGRYAIWRPEARGVAILDFGASQKPAEAQAAAEPAEGEAAAE